MHLPHVWDPRWVAWLLASYARLLGRPLEPARVGDPDLPRWLYEDAPYCLLAHDGGADPRFLYVNRAAQRCFEYEWPELVGMPSRLSAEPDAREERQHFVEQVRQFGYGEGYRGIRIAKSGRRFWIENVTLWNVHDDEGVFRGQAATYRGTSPA